MAPEQMEVTANAFARAVSKPRTPISGAISDAVVIIATVDDPCAVLSAAAIMNGSQIPRLNPESASPSIVAMPESLRTIPNDPPAAVIMMIMRVGGLMNLGFEKVYLMQNDLNLTSSEVISTYVYKIGVINTQYSYSAAINLFSTIVNFILLILVNQISKKVSENSLW